MVNRWKYIDTFNAPGIIYDSDLLVPVSLFTVIALLSAVITVYRYMNFLPFLSTGFHDIAVNIEGTGSRGSAYWTIKYFFNALVGIGLLLVIFNALKRKADIIRVVIIIIASNILVFAVGFYQHYYQPTFGSLSFWAEADRINATFTDPNSLGNYILIIFPIYIILIIYFRKWYQKALCSLALILLLIITLFTGSRNAFIGIILSSAIFAVLGLIRLIKIIIKKCRASRAVRRSWISVGALLMVIFIVMISLVSYIVVEKPELKDMYRPPETGISLIDRSVDTVWMSYNVYRQAGIVEGFKSVSSERHFIWPQALDMFSDYPASGVGIGSFIIELPNYYVKNNAPMRIVDFTGNYYLQILSEFGITGLILVLAIFILIIKKSTSFFIAHRKKFTGSRESWFFRGFLISFIVTVIILFFGPHTNFNEIQFTFWTVIGLLISYIKISETTGGVDGGIPAGVQNGISRKGFTRKLELDLAQKIGAVLIVAIFSISLLSASWSGLSINEKPNIYGYDASYGFYEPDMIYGKPCRWTGIDASESITNNHQKMIVPVQDLDPAEKQFPLFIRFFINNRLVKVVHINDNNWHDITIDLTDFSEEKLNFTISCSRSWIPKQRGLSNDTRELGVLVGEYKFEQ